MIVFFAYNFYSLYIYESSMNRPKRVVNCNLAATSTVRLIQASVAPNPEQSERIILKPRDQKKQLSGTALLIKLAKQLEEQKMRERLNGS